MFADTSREAYASTIETRAAQCERLYAIYKRHTKGLSDRQAAILMGWGAMAGSKVSARRPDICKDKRFGLVVELGRIKDSFTGKTVKVYGAAQDTLFKVQYNDL